jgi:hypothetical protein
MTRIKKSSTLMTGSTIKEKEDLVTGVLDFSLLPKLDTL